MVGDSLPRLMLRDGKLRSPNEVSLLSQATSKRDTEGLARVLGAMASSDCVTGLLSEALAQHSRPPSVSLTRNPSPHVEPMHEI